MREKLMENYEMGKVMGEETESKGLEKKWEARTAKRNGKQGAGQEVKRKV